LRRIQPNLKVIVMSAYSQEQAHTTLGGQQPGSISVSLISNELTGLLPPDVCHGWRDITDHVNYLSVRPDSDRVLPAGYVNPAKK
jgi:hypothetical protein